MAEFRMYVTRKSNPHTFRIELVRSPQSGKLAETYYRAMHYVRLWNALKKDDSIYALMGENPKMKLQKTFDLEAEALYGYEDIEL